MLQLRNLIRTALRSLTKNRMRSLLTSLGIIIGVSAVIIMVAIGEGSQAQIARTMNMLGTDLIIAFPASSRMGGVSRGAGSFNRFTFADVEKIRQSAQYIAAVSPVVTSGGQIIGGGKNWSTTVFGVTPDYFTIRNWQVKSGDFFSDRDDRSRRKVCLLGNTVAEALYGDQDPVGQKVRIRNTPFTVVGVLRSKGQSAAGADQDDVILAPSTTVLYRLRGGQNINMINASAKSGAVVAQAQAEMAALLRSAHHIEPGEEDDFVVRTQAEITEAASAASKVMTMLLAAVAGVSLIVGGIGIMNIMLVSVTERTREIGIRMSVGARSSDILTQFLSEAVVLSLSGGLIGILLSVILCKLLNQFTSYYTVISPEIVLISVLFSAAVGVFFGFYPARKAAGLNPIDALRYE
ncbi:MAG TPA: ABC transporter permease [bacterium]|nr:ABC transporter permease [bacterium]HQI49189.1 ABC transporter permease [bacterium]HQJ64110.1 ABC transporter permease [bacterium]